MKLKYLGTSASEGIPTVMCACELCEKARRLKGPYIRTRMQAELKRRMMELGVADENTRFVLSHFSHNGGHIDHDELCEIAKEFGFVVSYDGMEITV